MIDTTYAKTLVGKHIYVLTRHGHVVDGILDKVDNQNVYLSQNAEKAKSSAFFSPFSPILPLVLFDLLAIGTSPFAFGGIPFFF